MESAQHVHRPVLLDESLEGLAVRADGVYLDGTFGRGGHSGAILERLGPQGRLLASDKDPLAQRTARERFAADPRFELVAGSYLALAQATRERGLAGEVNGILLDLGVSSPQLDDAERGFSFLRDGPLDMRMDPDSGLSAADWLAVEKEEGIAAVLKEYGEERYAKRIARAIVRTREQEGTIRRTGRLAEVVAAANPRWERDKHPATRSFQAIRIYINGELDELERFLAEAVALLAPGGRLAVISFHSLEDRLVKRFIRDQARGPELPPDLPVMEQSIERSLRPLGRAIRAGETELAENPRARSAVLRVAERT